MSEFYTMREAVREVAAKFGVDESRVCTSIVEVIDRAGQRGPMPGFTRVAERILRSSNKGGFSAIISRLKMTQWKIGQRELQKLEAVEL